MSKDEYTFAVHVDIRPLWIRPAERPMDAANRAQTEVRFAALAGRIEQIIRARLEQMGEEQGEDVHQWLLMPFRPEDFPR